MTEQDHAEAALRSVAGSPRAPGALRAALAEPHLPDAFRAGQLWRARWQRTSALLLLLADEDPAPAAGTRRLHVAFASAAEAPAAGSAVPALTAATQTLRALTVWPSLHAHVGTHVLTALLEESAQTADLARSAAAAGPGSLESAIDPFDPSARLLAELGDELATLAEAATVPVAADGPPVALKTLLPGPPAEQLRTLVEQLNVRQDQAMALLRGQHSLTGEQARQLETAHGLPTGTLPDQDALPADVVRELDHPRWRASWQAAAQATGADEVSVKQHVGRRAYALAARESTTTPDWAQRIALVLSADT